jgi:DNA topoisomerase-6 subunit B
VNQPKDSLPLGPYIFAVSVVSPFIKFKNASKETIDASDELVEEIRRAARRLSRVSAARMALQRSTASTADKVAPRASSPDSR